MSLLCKYKNMFGIPNKGLHSYRIFTPFNISNADFTA